MIRTIVILSSNAPPEGFDLDGYEGFNIFWYRFFETEPAEVQAMLDLCRRKRADAVLAGSPDAVALAAQVSELLGLSWQAGCRAQWLVDRALLLDGLAGARIDTIDYRLAVRAQEAESAVHMLGEPVIVQSVEGVEGYRSRFVLHVPEARLAFNQVTKTSATKRALVTHPESAARFSVYSYVRKGSISFGGIVDVEPDPQFMFPRYVSTPSRLTHETQEELTAIAREVVQNLRLTNGVLRVDLMQRGDSFGVSAVESAPISNWLPEDIVRLSGAGDLYRSTLLLATGEPAVAATAPRQACGIIWLTSRSGEVVDIDGLDAAKDIEGVHAVRVRLKPGDVVRHVVDQADRDRIGYAVVCGPDAAFCYESARQVCEAVTIQTQTLYATTGS